MKQLFTFFILIGVTLCIAQPKLAKQEIGEGISMLVPEELKRTPPTMQRTTSPALAVFNSRDGLADLGINQAQLRWNASDLDLLSQFYKANILNLYDNVTMHREGIKEINGRSYIVFEFTGIIVDEENAFSSSKQTSDYTYIMYTVNDAGVLIFRFTSPAFRRSYWQGEMREAMESITFSQKKRRR